MKTNIFPSWTEAITVKSIEISPYSIGLEFGQGDSQQLPNFRKRGSKFKH